MSTKSVDPCIPVVVASDMDEVGPQTTYRQQTKALNRFVSPARSPLPVLWGDILLYLHNCTHNVLAAVYVESQASQHCGDGKSDNVAF